MCNRVRIRTAEPSPNKAAPRRYPARWLPGVEPARGGSQPVERSATMATNPRTNNGTTGGPSRHRAVHRRGEPGGTPAVAPALARHRGNRGQQQHADQLTAAAMGGLDGAGGSGARSSAGPATWGYPPILPCKEQKLGGPESPSGWESRGRTPMASVPHRVTKATGRTVSACRMRRTAAMAPIAEAPQMENPRGHQERCHRAAGGTGGRSRRSPPKLAATTPTITASDSHPGPGRP